MLVHKRRVKYPCRNAQLLESVRRNRDHRIRVFRIDGERSGVLNYEARFLVLGVYI